MAASNDSPSPSNRALPRMMLGFVIRRCTVELGHPPTAAELAAWANRQPNGDDQPHHLFGRPITEREAAVILKHQSRLVSAQSAQADEIYVAVDDLAALPVAANVVRLDAARARRQSKRR